MNEYIVEQHGFGYHSIPDQEDESKEPYPHFFKKSFAARLTESCNTRAQDGWRLAFTSAAGSASQGMAFLLFFERPHRSE